MTWGDASAFRKSHPGAPDGYFRWEAAGLCWLSATATVPVAGVLDVGAHHLALEQLAHASPTAAAAERFGEQLAALHLTPAAAWGAPPDGWEGNGFLGPLGEPLPLPLGPWPTWGAMQAARIRPLTEMVARRGALTPHQTRALDAWADDLDAGRVDDPTSPAPIHGDLWAGNLMWTPDGVVVIDPAAHTGHPDADIAMLHLFGCTHLEAIMRGYTRHRSVDADRLRLHQIHPLLLHAALFGGAYGEQAYRIVTRPLP